jgi:hypothetical protein
MSAPRSTYSHRGETLITLRDLRWSGAGAQDPLFGAGAGQTLIKTWAAPIWRICVRRRDATGTTLAAPCSPNPVSSSCAAPDQPDTGPRTG